MALHTFTHLACQQFARALKLRRYMTVCGCVCSQVSGYFCTQDTLPTMPEGSTPTPVAAVSQYACQRRTTTENNNKIFTVRNCYLTSPWTQAHFYMFAHQRQPLRLCSVKSPLICSALIGWLACFTHQRSDTTLPKIH